MNYPTLKNLLMSILSVDVGLSDSEETAAIDISLQNPAFCQKLRQELLAFNNSGESWMELLDNQEFCVYPAESEDEAKQYVMDKFGSRLLP